ncbi:MAG TPA: protein-L-isoaspartate(D-aspartate) O-methyltransferase [Pirellulales bacterium]|jgi:protein-L-isoaspartate(D-aspartate) O-methyltransferase|nr:protein-L-isoaspartate(D-aspartate) O-methyltransferase [Pirellulales bacterium]
MHVGRSDFGRGICRALVLLLILCASARFSLAQTARQWAAARQLMVESEVASAGVKHEAVLAAMRGVPRHEFLPADVRKYAYLDMALPIGERQTISPPFIVGWMTERLDPQPADVVLEIGTGSGYQAAILSRLVKQVYTIEIVPDLAERAAATFARLKYKNIETREGDGYQGWAEHAPFDKIIVTCSPEKIPRPLIDQLREGGKIVAPLGERYQQTLYVLTKHEGKLKVESREPTFFVPMTGQAERVRTARAAERFTALVNPGFEQVLDSSVPAGWYYLRQAKLGHDGPIAETPQCITFTNRVPGRSSQVLQAIGVDGRQVNELKVELWVRAREVELKEDDAHGSTLMFSFFDEDRVPLGQQTLGSWKGNFDWQRRAGVIRVPEKASVAILALGLLGATGELSCDELSVTEGTSRTARK